MGISIVDRFEILATVIRSSQVFTQCTTKFIPLDLSNGLRSFESSKNGGSWLICFTFAWEKCLFSGNSRNIRLDSTYKTCLWQIIRPWMIVVWSRRMSYRKVRIEQWRHDEEIGQRQKGDTNRDRIIVGRDPGTQSQQVASNIVDTQWGHRRKKQRNGISSG